MRLRLSVQRNNLPVTNILWSVPDTNSPHAYTIARLLEDVNQVLPLEAEQWGLEDYIVEVSGFECLHFSPVSQALKDDDHVSIRPLLTAEVRSRTLCGRHQISEDGRHLVDGIPFGRPYLRQPSRPAVRIPPRKRRRLEEDTEIGAEEIEIAGLITMGETSPLFIGNGPTTSATSPQDKQARVGKGDRAVRFAQAEADNVEDSDEEDEEFAPSGESDSDASMDSDTDSGSSSSASDSSDGSESSSSERVSESDSDSDSSSSGSDSESVSSVPDVVSSKTLPKPFVPPGDGHKDTKLRNRRRVQSEKLRRLKSAGKLAENATLDDLRIYIENGGVTHSRSSPANTMSAPSGKRKRLAEESAVEPFRDETTELERRKQEFMANMERDTPQSEALRIMTPEAHGPQVETPKAATPEGTSETTPLIGEDEAAPPKKRLRPDTSAIGRMLARQTRNVEKKSLRTKRPIEQTPEPEGASDPDFWKSRIKLSAFECWDEEVELSAPPFPFKQHWDPASKHMRNKLNKKKNKKSKKNGPERESASPQVEENTETLILDYDDSPDPTKQDSDHTAAIENQLIQDVQVAAQSDLPSLPEDVEALPALEPQDIQVGTIVVFKMWVINSKTVTPEFSEYRTAIVEKEGDSGNGAGSFRLRLAARDVPKEQKVDENGERVKSAKNGFQMDVHKDEEEDEGIWEGTFTELISPKLLKPVE